MMDKHDGPSDGSVVTIQNAALTSNQATEHQEFISLLLDSTENGATNSETLVSRNQCVEEENIEEENAAVEADPVDTHTCAACQIVFTCLEDYVRHKLSNDNCKVQYTKQRRLLIPKIVKREAAEEKTRPQTTGPSKRGRKKGSKLKKPALVPPAEEGRYNCEICQRSFGRSAALRNHVSRDHHRGGDSDEEEVEEDAGAADAPEESADDPAFTYTAWKRNSQSKKDCIILQKTAQCTICKRFYKDQYTLRAHMTLHVENNLFSCKWKGCPFSFKTKGSLKRHMRRHTGERPYKCDKCGMSFAESGALTRHWKSRTPCTNKSDGDYPCYGKKKPLQVNADGESVKLVGREKEEGNGKGDHATGEDAAPDKATTGEEEIAEMDSIEEQSNKVITADQIDGNMVTYVMEQVVGAEESVPMEGVVTENAQDINAHSVDLHSSSACIICEMKFADLSVLQEHLVSHFGLSPLKCCLCESVLPLPFQLAEHLLVSHPSEVGVASEMNMVPLLAVSPDIDHDKAADDMDNAFGDVNRALQQFLILNKQTESLNAPEETQTFFQCGECSTFYKTKWQLKGHMLTTHDKKKLFPCEVCGKTFHIRDALSKHMTSHSEERHYKCGECGKTFKRISHVREHLKVHSSERPYPCPICGKSFKTANASKVHLRTHTNYMPFQCSVCHKAFREKSSLERHQRTHTGEKPFACKRCGRCFSEHGTLNRHMKAKVPCTHKTTEQLAEDQLQQQQQPQETPSLLAEFSSMVADTQQYIVQNEDKDQYVTLVSEGDIPQENNVIMVQEGISHESVLQGSVHYVDDQGQLVSANGNQGVQYLLVESGTDGQMKLVMQEDDGQAESADSNVLDQDGQVEYTVVAVDEEATEGNIKQESNVA